MKIYEAKEMIGGWFVGDFKPTAYKTKKFEVCYKIHQQGEKWPKHYHKIATEINYLIRGKMTIGGKEIHAGQIFILKPGEIAEPNFLEDCEIIVIKTPSVVGDKYESI